MAARQTSTDTSSGKSPAANPVAEEIAEAIATSPTAAAASPARPSTRPSANLTDLPADTGAQKEHGRPPNAGTDLIRLSGPQSHLLAPQ